MLRLLIPKAQLDRFKKMVEHNIKTVRETQNLSIEDLANKTYYPPRLWACFEEDCTAMRLYDLLYIATALNVSPEVLITPPSDHNLKTDK